MIIASSPRFASTLTLSIGLLLAAAGCTARVAIAPGEASSSGGGSATSVAATTSGAGGGGAGTGGSAACVPHPDMSGTFMEPTCADLDGMSVAHPVIVDANGNGEVEAGESVVLHVALDEVAGLGFSFYPGVHFETESPGVTVGTDDWFYAILPCQHDEVSGHITIGKDVAPGTIVTITARVAMLNDACTEAPSILIPITVH